MSEDYSNDQQKAIIEALLSDGTLLARCQNILQPNFFNKQLEKSVKFILKFTEDYKSVPTTQQLFAETGIQFTLIENMPKEHQQYFLDEIEKFVKRRALTQAILAGAELLDKGDDFGGIEKMVKDALTIGLHKDLGTEYFKDPKERLLQLKDSNGNMSTGWLTLDQKIYGVGRGELLLFAAPSGGGKSVALQNLAINMALQAYNAIFITLELSEGLCAKRMDSMVSGIKTTDIYKRIDDVELNVKITAKQAGKITIKKMPGGSNARDMKSYIREYITQQQLNPDVLIVDYLDLMMPNDKRVSPSDLFVKDKYISEELRNLAEEFNLLCATASQFNRSAIDSVEFNHSHIAGGLSKIQTSDNAIGIFNTARSRERGEIEFQLLKTRNSGGVDQKITLGYNIDTLRISDLDMSNVKAKDSRSDIMNKINRKDTKKDSEDSTIEQEVPVEKESAKEDPIKRMARLKNLVNKQE